MLNLLRMNFYRMIKTKAMWIVLVCICLFGVLSCFIEKIDWETGRENANRQEAAQMEPASAETEEDKGVIDGFKAGFSESGDDANSNISKEDTPGVQFEITKQPSDANQGERQSFLEVYHSDISGGAVIIFIVIAGVIFVNGEDKTGFVKNIAGQTRYRGMIYLSKIPVIVCYNAFALLLYGAVQYVFLQIFFHGGIEFGTEYLKESVILFGMNVLLYAAFSSGLAFLTTVAKSTAVGITVGMLIAMGFGNSLAGYIGLKLNVELIKYLLVFNSSQMVLGIPAETVRFAFVVGMVYLVLYNVLGMLWFTKKDVV